MFSKATTILLALGLMALADPAFAQVSDGGVSFVDRNQTGEIVLGAYRGGISVIDYDRDGFADIVVGDAQGFPNRLFHNVPDPIRPGARTFLDATSGSGLNDAEGTGRTALATVVADYDNDNDDDIYIIGFNGSDYGLLYRNDGGGHFTNVSLTAGVRGIGGVMQCASWSDFDLDGDVDLLVLGRAAPFSMLYRNNGDGTFADATNLLPAITTTAHFYSAAWMDYDTDGYPDCFPITSAGAAHDVVLHNIDDGAGGRRFENTAVQIGFVNLGVAPMGIAFGDFDLDGDFDIGISDAIVGTYFRNDGGTMTRITPFATMFGWGVDWIDVNNDTRLDFYTAGSWATARLDNLQRNEGGGVFSNISPVLNTVALATQYSVQLDFNNDGRQDIIAVNPSHSISIYENASTTANHWLRLVVRGDGAGVNRNAIGAEVRLTAGGVTQIRQVSSGSSTTSTEDMRLHFGLGSAATVDEIEVLWPRSGSIASRTEIFAGPISVDGEMLLTPGLPNPSGDLNCDGMANGGDVSAFVLATIDTAAYEDTYSACDMLDGDFNMDTAVTHEDVPEFVALLIGG